MELAGLHNSVITNCNNQMTVCAFMLRFQPNSYTAGSFYDWMTNISLSHSAILYLNDNFDGGELFFTNRDAKTVTVSHSNLFITILTL